MKREIPREHYSTRENQQFGGTKIKMHYSQLFMLGRDLY